jgi:adenine-specific DNA glycosylase
VAHAAGNEFAIPAPKHAVVRKPLYCASVIIQDSAGRIAVERRPSSGMWGNLWQAPTLESPDRAPSPARLLRWLSKAAEIPAMRSRHLTRIETFSHSTTHRDVSFDVWRWTGPVGSAPAWEWFLSQSLGTLALSSAQQRVLSSCAT